MDKNLLQQRNVELEAISREMLGEGMTLMAVEQWNEFSRQEWEKNCETRRFYWG